MKRVVPSVVFLLLLLCPACPSAYAQSSATVAGVVRDLQGAPQMGALVELLSADATVVAQTFTDDHGRYLLSPVSPGRYQLRASAAFLIPVLRTNVRLNAGVAAMANLTMTAVFEMGGWFPVTKRTAAEPADDWRWTLRSTANRPILRLDEDGQDAAGNVGTSESEHPREVAFHGRVAVGMRAGEFANGGAHEEFTAERRLAAGVTESLTATVGQPGGQPNAEANAADGGPSFALGAGYERENGLGGQTHLVATVQSHPEISGSGVVGLQAVSLATSERLAIGDAVMIDAGTLLTAERLVQSRAKAAPFARVVVNPTADIALMYRFASGRELQSSDDPGNLQLPSDTASDAEGRPILLNELHQEIVASHHAGGDKETVAIYQDELPMDTLQGSGKLSPADLAGLPVLADTTTGTFRVAVKGYTARGISVQWTHDFSPALAACAEADFGSALVRDEEPLALADLDSRVHTSVEPALRVALRGRLARTGTSFWTQYRWQPSSTLDAVNTFETTSNQAYLGFLLKQRLWSGHRLQGMDAVLAATNLLEEGYQPVVGPDGRTLFLTQAARTLQAGVSFSF